LNQNSQTKNNFPALERRIVAAVAGLYGSRMLGLFMVLPVMALYFGDYRGATPFLLGVSLGIYGFTQAIFQIPLGLLSDKIGRRSVIIGGLVLFVLGSVVAGLADSAVGLIVGRALQGTGAIASTLMALITDFTSEQNRTKAMAAVGGTIGISFALAMVIGPVIAAAAGLSGIFWLTAAFGLLGTVIVWFAVPSAVPRRQNRETLTDLSAIGRLLRDPVLQRLNLGIFSLHLVLMAAFVAVPSILSLELAIPEKDLWWVYIVLLGGGFVIMLPAVIVGEKYARQKHSFISAIALMALSVLILGLYRSDWVTLLMLLLFFSAFNLLEASLPSWLSKVCPAGNRGTAMGIYSTSQFMGAFVGGVIGGWALGSVGIDGLFFILAMILLIWLVVALGMQAPRPLQTLVLKVGDRDPQEFLKIISTMAGVEDILLIEGEELAYLKVDKKTVDLERLKPFLNNL
jgi:MFS family permease